jgi:hypothetical protein
VAFSTSILLRPDTALVERRVPTGVASFSGQPNYTPTTIASAIPCLIDPLPIGGRTAANLEYTVEGVVYLQTHVMFVSGIMPAQVASSTAGSTITINGVPYIVAANKRGGFVDCQAGDRVTDERGHIYLCLGQAQYYNVTPSSQIRLRLGSAWQ